MDSSAVNLDPDGGHEFRVIPNTHAVEVNSRTMLKSK